jgi:hypothetical protein
MADPTVVKQALRRLAYQRPTDAFSHHRLVQRASDALASVDDAATFCESVGTDRLRAAVRRADGRGEDDLVQQGRETLSTLQTYRQAAAGVETDDETESSDRVDHFHSGRGTPLPGAGQGGDR